MRMIPIVVLVQEPDLATLNRHLAPIVEGIESNPRAMQICRDHNWTSEQLAWSTLLHQAANALVHVR